MVGDQVAAKIHVDQRAHHAPHVGVAVVDEGLDEVGNRRGHVAEVNLPELAHLREALDGVEDVLAGVLAALHPGPAAQAHADIRTIRDLQRLHVAVVIAENAARHAGEFGDGRIVGVNPDANAQLFGHGHDLLDEVRVVLPDLFLRELAAVRKRRFEHLARPVALGRLHPEGARRRPATRGLARRAPDAVAHVRVGGVVNARGGQVPEVILVLLDFLVSAGKIQRHFRHVVDVTVADVPDLEARGFDAFLEVAEGLQSRPCAARRDVDVLDAELLGPREIFLGRVCAQLKGDLDSGRKLRKRLASGESGKRRGSGGSGGELSSGLQGGPPG